MLHVAALRWLHIVKRREEGREGGEGGKEGGEGGREGRRGREGREEREGGEGERGGIKLQKLVSQERRETVIA